MDAIGSILTAIFIAILIGVTLTFGFAIIAFILCVALVTTALIFIRQWWYRWRFVKNATKQERSDNKVIEGDYKDISGDKK